jgi:hypothetical protein
MNPRILNRDNKLPDDGWYNIEANGEHINHASQCVLVIDEKARTSISNRFSSEAAKVGADFPGQFVDRDHLSDSHENPTEAYGWAMQVRNRDGLLEAKVDWTALGLPLIESKDGRPPAYKFFSTEYDPGECEKIGTRRIANRTYDLLRPMRLDGLSLTNDPNNKGQRPISNRKGNPASAAEKETTIMKSVLKELGLADDASEESAVSALKAIKNRATSAETERDSLKTEHATLLDSQIETDLEKYKGVIKNRDTVKAQLKTNRKSTLELLESLAPAVDPKNRITNRTTATPPAGDRNSPGTEQDEETKARKINNRANELKGAQPTRPWSQCWSQAQTEAQVSTN